ncbi:MAG: sulfotransferase [Phycisphaerales bacterium]
MSQAQAIQQARSFVQRGESQRAAALCQSLLAKDRSNVEILYLYGSALTQLGRYGEARTHLARAVKAKPREAVLLHELALTYQGDLRFDDAEETFDRALALAPGSANLIAAKADLLRIRGAHEEAMALIEPALDKLDRSPQLMLVYLRLAPSVGRAEEAIERARAFVERGDLVPIAKMRAQYAMGHALDSLKRYDEAFEAFRKGNEAAPKTFNPEGHAAAVDRIITGWSKDAMASLGSPGAADARGSERAVFIVGMPRSGTSLVEQILSSHPGVTGGGELSAMAEIIFTMRGRDSDGLAPMPADLGEKSLGRAARAYLQALRKLDAKAARVTDKSPDNMYHLGFIASMLPEAKLIFVRRDFRDACVSCYTNSFRGAYTFTTDMAHLASYAHDTQRLLDHWRDALGERLHIVSYEGLVRDFERVTKELVSFVGVPWDEACLNYTESERVTMTLSNEQVREPIYTRSVGRWRNYERHLAPLLDGLRLRGVES